MIKLGIVLNSENVYVGDSIVEMQNTVVLVSGEKRTQFGKGSIKRVEEINVHNYIEDLVKELDEVNAEHIMADGRVSRWIEIAQFHEAHREYAKCDELIEEVTKFVEERKNRILTPSSVKAGQSISLQYHGEWVTDGKVIATTGVEYKGEWIPQIVVRPEGEIKTIELSWFAPRSCFICSKRGQQAVQRGGQQ